ncbi:glycosyltransferase [Lentzea jiangxiensis]|uniref:Glycosyltransferase, MGT family n=1 Tax=Lentzea jiangxiensis TaxID=641025 RepID=A0A1H0WB21_9PSEU|nr:glycosyltransferase [Lentzea jiangxiensis]SDP87635.1 glycosyltransferase, MGT family [Lentzea jiangxiensis]
MRILFSCRPAYGHVFPLVPLARAAREAGHEVVFATGQDFLGIVRDLGFEAHPAGISVGEAEAEARRRHGDADVTRLMITMFADVLPRATAGDLAALLPRVRPDLVVYEQSDVGAAKAARDAGIPVVSHVIGRSMPPPVQQLAAPEMAWLWDGAAPADLMLGDVVVDLWPDVVRDPVVAALPTVLRQRPAAFDLDVPMPEVESAKPLVYLTLGTVSFGRTEVLRAAVDGLARLPVTVLVALGPGDPALLGEVPGTVHVAGFVPQAQVLRRADLVVHHGGTGTVLGALAAGLPQLVLPQGADQFVNADVLAQTGAGAKLVGPEATADAVTAAARHLLDDPAARNVATTAAAEIARMPEPAAVVEELTALVRGTA